MPLCLNYYKFMIILDTLPGKSLFLPFQECNSFQQRHKNNLGKKNSSISRKKIVIFYYNYMEILNLTDLICLWFWIFQFMNIVYHSIYLELVSVIKNLINQSKKEMGNFIQANLRIITWEEHLRKLWELFHALELKEQLCKFLRQRTV